MIHRDLKPSNVQVMPDGTIKVLDFGVAKMLPRDDTLTEAPTTKRSAASARSDSPGTPVYMAPEQLIGGRADARSDIYSLGVVLFEMLTGRRPYLETDSIALAVAMSTSPPPPPDAIDPRIPRGLSSVVVKALQHEPFNRYQSAPEIAEALEELTEPTTREVAHVGRHLDARRSRRLSIAAITLLVVGLAASIPFITSWVRSRAAAGGVAPSIAILPVDNPTDDPQAEHLGFTIATTLGANLRSIDGLHVLPRESIIGFRLRRRDFAALKREAGADHVLDLTMTKGLPAPQLQARLTRTDPPTVEWQATISGGAAHVQDAIVEGVTQALARGTGGRAITFTSDESRRLRKAATHSDEAMQAYVEAQALLDRTDLSTNVMAAIDRLQQAVAADPNFALGYAALATAVLGRYERALKDWHSFRIILETDATERRAHSDP